MDRLYKWLVLDHLKQYRQMVFLAGQRQVGKSTIAQEVERKTQKHFYFNWDVKEDREKIISGPKSLGEAIGLGEIQSSDVMVVFDEIHKYPKWKQFLKGYFDSYAKRCKIVVPS